MRITRVETIPVSLRLTKPVVMADKVISESRNVLVRITTEDGATGWGEAAEAPLMTGHTQEMIAAAAEELGSELVGAAATDRARFWSEHRRDTNSSALAALDIALADLEGRTMGLPAYRVLGGMVREQVPVLSLFGTGNAAHDIADVRGRYLAGFRWFKMKLGLASPETESRVLHELRGEFGEEIVLAGDANTAWDPPEAIRNLRMLDGLGLAFVEQPVAAEDVEGMETVSEAVGVAIGADEGVHGISDVVRFAATAVAGVSLKSIKTGGLTGLVQAATVADYLGLHVNLGGKVAETSISSAAIAHAAAAVPSVTWGVSVTHDLISQDVVPFPLSVEDGLLRPPTRPGLGIDVDLAKVESLRI